MFNRMRATTFTILLLATASPAIINNTAVAQTQSSTKIASTVLATANGQQLTQGMVDSIIRVGEFLAGHKFSQADKHWIRELAIKSFRENPNQVVQDDKFTRQILSGINKHSQNPINLAQGRERLFTNIYLFNLANNSLNKPSIMTIVYKYSPVIFADPKYKVVVTKRTIDSLITSRNFVAKLAGQPLRPIDYNWWARYLQQKYYKELTPNQRHHYVTAESRWVRLQQAWSKASPQKRQKVTAFINQQLQDGLEIPTIARYLEYNVNGKNTASMDNLLNAMRQERNIQNFTTRTLPSWGRYMDSLRMRP